MTEFPLHQTLSKRACLSLTSEEYNTESRKCYIKILFPEYQKRKKARKITLYVLSAINFFTNLTFIEGPLCVVEGPLCVRQ